MRVERRDGVVRLIRVTNLLRLGLGGMGLTKSYSISKLTVWEAYQQVKANRGAAGIDKESISIF